jgi:SAM-dependent methyltransferase
MLSAEILSGEALFGDDFRPEEIARWYEEERRGYFELLAEAADPMEYSYRYSALNDVHAFDFVRRDHYPVCLALGCARGDDVAALADVVDEYIAIEPAEEWWADSIGGKPARYVAPSLLGDIPLDSDTVDIATSIGVLHHIPNVSHVVSEVARVVKPGGLFVLREPIQSMGDFRKPRPNLTRNERGIPHLWFEKVFAQNGLVIERRRFCMLSPMSRIAKRIAGTLGYESRAFVQVDRLLSAALKLNIAYWRPGFLKKIAPSSAFYVLRKS